MMGVAAVRKTDLEVLADDQAPGTVDKADDVCSVKPESVFLWDMRELQFVLWEFFKLDRLFLGNGPCAALTRPGVEALLDRACKHANKLAEACLPGDRDRARLLEDGAVHVPESFRALWEEHKQDWFSMRQQVDTVIVHKDETERYPPLVNQLVLELFAGANASFMTYGAFTPSAATVIRHRGTDAQKALFLDKLDRVEWDACFCATETGAGSDVMAITTFATHVDGEVYSIVGEKRYITAGMHDLTRNTIYMVLGRIKGGSNSLSAISCFLVPRFWPNPDGTLEPNFVECAQVEDKMGLNGCANTRLLFGKGGASRGFLLGNQPNVALMQLSVLMRKARIGTGNIAEGMASSAYLHALRYARTRIQGPAFDAASNLKASKVPIIEHRDVQRMLLEMKAKVEGCRILLGRISHHSSCIQHLLHQVSTGAASRDQVAMERHASLALLYAPVAKAYLSDEAWNVTTLAVQVHGAVGYLRDQPLEQYLRDLKILTIWEGTNYIQSVDLVRDKLGFGRNAKIMKEFEHEVRQSLAGFESDRELEQERAAFFAAFDALAKALARFAEFSLAGDKLVVSQFCTRYLGMFGDVLVGWNLIEAAYISAAALRRNDVSETDQAFYRGKIATARFFCHNVLPGVAARAAVIENAQQAYVKLPSADFGFVE